MSEVYLPPVFRGPEIFEVKAESMPWHITDVRLQEYWENTGGGEGVLVGVADTGCDVAHPDILGRVKWEESFVRRNWLGGTENTEDGNGHGTHVATTIAAMAPNCDFAIAKVLGANGGGTNQGVMEGIRALVNEGCNIINLSLGGPSDDPQTREAVLYAKSKNCPVFIATGNEGASAVGFPAQHGVGIGAIGRDRKLAYFSNRGKHVDLVGYGVGILAGVPGGLYQEMSGTSMATPWNVGIAANRLSAELKHWGEIYTNSDERMLELETFTVDLGPEGKDTSYGRGMIDLEKCLKIQPEPDSVESEECLPHVSVVIGERHWSGILGKGNS